MWWIKTQSTGEERGGFQDRDIGRKSFNDDYGPDFGIDYARFSDPPNLSKDLELKKSVEAKIQASFPDERQVELKVRNGFVILKGTVSDQEFKSALLETIYSCNVKEIISELKIQEVNMEDTNKKKKQEDSKVEFNDNRREENPDSTFSPHSDQKGGGGGNTSIGGAGKSYTHVEPGSDAGANP